MPAANIIASSGLGCYTSDPTPIQLHANGLGKAAEGGPNTWIFDMGESYEVSSSWLQAWPSHCSFWGSESPGGRSLSMCFSLPFPLLLWLSQINT